ncbi:hypothetical protein Terro_3731 [Terriglobus roseus DSM 18391]|uniref:Murein endopeptidase K n=1 Tax=Terriglobus roseus (strain DSM 18391 / NRRL B-41598 / KBS 63) TaxID=926566 RepID=I3ZL24_TERRK|nr:DUF882 domain-containing protein [Terriglobus roseus]AFL89942.1 hypothetical protein Terro_3731 [Terriglobus roseus DSM 18391]
MTLRLPRPFRPFASVGLLSTLCVVVLLGAVTPSASARRFESRRHPRLRAIAHAFVNVALPGMGLLPDDEAELPVEGQKYELKLVHPSGEMIDVVYRVGDTYVPEALDKLSNFLRDSHNQEVTTFDPRTFDVLHTMLAKVGKSTGVINILSAYRTQETNDALRASGTTNAAEHSQHIEAKAIDLRLPGVSAATLRDAALSLGAGGVGYYPKGQFIHVDVGPVRQWTFAPHSGKKHSRHRRRA